MYQIVIETPKGSFVKRNEEGNIDLISPFSCPFNYGRVVGYHGRDGDPLDAILLGEAVSYNSTHEAPLIGVVRFVDGGEEDHKLIFSTIPPTRRDEEALKRFFHRYAQIKNLTRLLQFRRCPSQFLGLEWGITDITYFSRR